MDLPPLKASEQEVARLIARLRHETNRAAGVVDMKRGPQSGEDTDLNGVAGEFAFCKAVNAWPDLDTTPRSGGPDCRALKWRVDVKTTTHPQGHLAANLGTAPDNVHAYVLVIGTFPGPFRLAGWCKSGQLILPKRHKELGGTLLFALAQEQLARWRSEWRQ